MRIITKIKDSFFRRLIASILIGKWISYSKWIGVNANQSSKGMQKYGHYIDECPKDKFDWIDMALEELVDFFAYREKMKE